MGEVVELEVYRLARDAAGVEIEFWAHPGEYAAPFDAGPGDDYAVPGFEEFTREETGSMRIVARTAGRSIVLAPDAEEQFYSKHGLAGYILIEGGAHGVNVTLRCTNNDRVLYSQWLEYETIMLYLPKLSMGKEYELSLMSPFYFQKDVIFHPETMNTITKVGLKPRVTPTLMKRAPWYVRTRYWLKNAFARI